MKVASTTFYCDMSRCPATVTVMEEPNTTSAYLALVEARWKVVRPVMTGWKHYCPEHAAEAKA